jgi:hypothetical protein
MGDLKPWLVRVGYYFMTVNAIIQAIAITFLGYNPPKWSVVSFILLLAIFLGEESVSQWKLARRFRGIQEARLRKIQETHQANLNRTRLQEPVRLIEVRKIDGDNERWEGSHGDPS